MLRNRGFRSPNSVAGQCLDLVHLPDLAGGDTIAPTQLRSYTTQRGDAMPTFTKRIQVLLSPSQFTRLRSVARERGESVGSLIRKAIEEVYLRHEEQERLE